MALKIKKKNTRIMSVYHGQNSFISKIGKERFYKIKKNDMGEDYPSAIERDVTEYNIFFNIDMRKLLGSKVQSLDFSILKSSTLKSLGMFDLAGNLDQENIAASLYSSTSEARRRIYQDIQEKTIHTGKIDLTKKINGVKFSKDFKNRTDDELFGKIKRIKLVDPKSLGKKGLNKIRLAQADTSTFDIDSIDSQTSFSSVYKDAICNNMDPGSAFFPVESTISLLPKIGHTNIGKLSNFYTNRNIKNINTLRSKFENAYTGLNTSIGDVIEGKPKRVGIVVEEPHRIQTINHIFKVDSSIIDPHDSFVVLVSARDQSTGLISEAFEFRVAHKINIENYYIPEVLPNLSIIRDKPQKGYSNINGIIDYVDSKIKGIEISTRTVDDDFSISNSSFSDITSLESINEIKNQDCYKISNISSINMSQMGIVRIIPTTVADLKILNFSSDSVRGENFKYINSGLYTSNMRDGICVRYFVDSTKVSGIGIYRKLKHEKEYSPIRYGTESSWGPGGFSDAIYIGSPPISQNARKVGSLNVVDTIPRANDVIDYRLRLFLKNGGDEYSKAISTIKRIEPANIVNVKLSEPQSSADMDSRFIVSKFNIDFEMVETSGDKILKILREIGNEDIFESEIEITKSSLSDMCVFAVRRINLLNSESTFLGYHPAGDFVDRGPLISGNVYTYYVTAHLTNADQVQKSFNLSKLTSKNIISTTKDIRSPSTISRIQSAQSVAVPPDDRAISAVTGLTSAEELSELEKRYELIKEEKSFSYRSLISGMIFSSNRTSQLYDFNKYNTGDHASVSLRIVKSSYNITGKSGVTLTRSNMGAPVIRFSVSPVGNSRMKTLDCVVITCVRNGKEIICGACHNDGTGDFVFIDYGSKNYQGSIQYFATTVTTSGVLGNKKMIASNVLLELRPSNIKVGN